MLLCHQSDIDQRVGFEKVRLWAFQDASPEPDPDVIQAACQWATDEITAMLTNLYAAYLPFTALTLPVVVKNIAVAFAVYWLASRHDDISDAYVLSYKDARKQLEAIARGDIALIAPDGTALLDATPQPAIATHYALSTTSGQTPIFSRQTLSREMRR